VMKEGIQLPTIVVVGDQSSGKSSVLDSLAGISLPRGPGICTRVPLIMRLQNHTALESELSLEYHGKVVQTDEAHISEAIDYATQEVAGNAKGISNLPLTLVVKKNGVPDLSMPENIYEQIRDIIMEYITPEESIILNALSATVDFSTCESIRMSQTIDKTGTRTLAAVTKADRAPEGLLEKVSNDEVSIGLGYVCIRGIELGMNPLKKQGCLKESMNKILIRGEYDEFPDEKEMHCMARLSEMLNECFIELQAKRAPTGELGNFLMDEVNVLLEAKGIVLPSFLPRAAFLYLLQKKVKGISSTLIDFVKKVWSYLENVLLAVLMQHSENCP
ncbi:hypothetical protein Ancab_000328, partial [Ancistrocladus abbreviatus]